MRFDPRSAKSLQPGQHLLVDGCPGLRLKCNGTRKTWVYRYELDGKMKQKAFGHWPGMPLHEAVTLWGTLRSPEAKAAPKSDPATYSVGQVIDDYKEGHLRTSRTPASFKAAVATLGKASELRHLPAASIGRTVAFDLINQHKDIPEAARKLKSLLASAWDYALDAGTLDEDTPNRWREVMKGRLVSKGKTISGEHVGVQRRYLTDSEVSTLLKWMDSMTPLARDITVLYLWTCARGGEILSMEPGHIRQEGGQWWWTVPKALTKNAKSPFAVDLRVPLFGLALEVVLRRMKAAPMFLGATGEPMTQRIYSTYIYSLQPYSKRHALLRCPVTNWSPHNLRRTSRTMLSGLGCSNEIGEAILGHLPATMVATYNAHTYDRERVEWLKKLSDHLDQLHSSPAATDRPPA